jgi:hypothetical protein
MSARKKQPKARAKNVAARLRESTALTFPGDFTALVARVVQNSKKSDSAMILHEAGAEIARGFSSRLSWTHYRALLKVTDPAARAFYEIEAERENWSTPHRRTSSARSSRRSTCVGGLDDPQKSGPGRRRPDAVGGSAA